MGDPSQTMSLFGWHPFMHKNYWVWKRQNILSIFVLVKLAFLRLKTICVANPENARFLK